MLWAADQSKRRGRGRVRRLPWVMGAYFLVVLYPWWLVPLYRRGYWLVRHLVRYLHQGRGWRVGLGEPKWPPGGKEGRAWGYEGGRAASHLVC